MEIFPNNQWQSAFKTTETKCGQKENDHEQPDLRLAQRMEPLFNMRARRGLGGPGLSALGQDEQGQQEIGSAKRCRSPSWTHISEILQALAADERSKNKTETEGHADKPHFFRPFFRRCDISNVGLSDCYVPAAEPGKHSRQDHQPKSGCMVLHARAQRE